MHKFLCGLPKVEHHIHIEGSLAPATLFKLAKENGIRLPQDDPAYTSEETLSERYKHFSNLDDFLHYYYIGMSVLLSAKDFEDLAWAYFLKAHSQGVMHAEVFFDPQAHTDRGVEVSAVLQGLQSAQKRAEHELGLSSELICCFLRHLPQASALDLLRKTEIEQGLRDGGIRAVGLDSSENAFPPEMFREAFDQARQMGAHLTAHAGEEGPCENIAKSLDLLHCERIDHGVRLVEDPKLMDRVASLGTLLTMCPLSNVALGSFKHVSEAPIKTWLDKGVRFSINSDDPAYLGGYIQENYDAVQDAFHLTSKDWKRIVSVSIEGSWCSKGRKHEMMQRLDTYFHEQGL